MKSISKELISRVIKKRKSATHKGNYGRLLLIGGSKKYGGALIMAAEGALNSGAGLVTVATDQVNIAALHTRDPEIMALNWDESVELKNLIKSSDVVICGMGLGLDEKAQQILGLVRDNISAHPQGRTAFPAVSLPALPHLPSPDKSAVPYSTF